MDWKHVGNGWDKVPIAKMDREPENRTLPTERDANAYLIAAAPDLLQAAEACLDYFVYMSEQNSDFTPDANWLKALVEAINQAQGLIPTPNPAWDKPKEKNAPTG